MGLSKGNKPLQVGFNNGEKLRVIDDVRSGENYSLVKENYSLVKANDKQVKNA